MKNLENLFNRNTIAKEIFAYLISALFGVSLAFIFRLFIVPNDFAPSGINGVAVLIQYKAGFSISWMSLIINVPLSIIAFFFIDKGFAIKSFIFSLFYSLAYLLFSNIEALNDYVYSAQGVDTIYPVLIAGFIAGIVNNITFRVGGSTGGTDFIAKFVAKKNPQLNFFWIVFSLNIVIAIVSCFVYKQEGVAINYKPACLCILYSFVSSFIGNSFIKQSKKAYKLFIVTSEPEKIEYEIVHYLKHSSTRLTAIGSYSNEGKTVLISVVNKHQLYDFKQMIHKFPGTFSFVETVNETVGNFKKIK